MALSLLILFGSGLHAQVLTCDADAFRNFDIAQMSQEYRAAFLQSIDRTKFEQIKSSSGGGGGFSIAGISLNANASYEEFNQKREAELIRVGYQESVENALSYVRNSFDGPGARAYNTCIQGLVRLQQQRGLFMWLLDTSDEAVTVKIHWRPTAGVTVRVNVARDVQLTGSTTSLRTFPVIWPADTEHQFILRRSRNRELRFVVNIGGDAASVVLPRKPTLRAPPPPQLPQCDSVVQLRNGISATAGGNLLFDGDKGSGRGINSGQAPSDFELNFDSPQWIHHLLVYPIADPPGWTTTQFFGVRSGSSPILFEEHRTRAVTGSTYQINFETSQSRGLTKIRVNTIDPRTWVAFSEIEVFVCQ
jgi:hypothetical protein